jgi:hypothetical protein
MTKRGAERKGGRNGVGDLRVAGMGVGAGSVVSGGGSASATYVALASRLGSGVNTPLETTMTTPANGKSAAFASLSASSLPLSSGSRGRGGARRVGWRDVLERLIVVYSVVALLCVWAVVKVCVLFVCLLLRMLSRHGVRGRHM